MNSHGKANFLFSQNIKHFLATSDGIFPKEHHHLWHKVVNSDVTWEMIGPVWVGMLLNECFSFTNELEVIDGAATSLFCIFQWAECWTNTMTTEICSHSDCAARDRATLCTLDKVGQRILPVICDSKSVSMLCVGTKVKLTLTFKNQHVHNSR